MNSIKGLILTTAIALTRPAVASDLWTYYSDEHKFSIKFPITWSRTEPSLPNIVIEAASENGAGCNIVTAWLDSLRNVSMDEILAGSGVAGMTDMMLTAFRTYIPDAEVINSDKFYVSNQLGFIVAYRGNIRAADATVPFRSFQIVTNNNERIYTITCGAAQETFEAHLDDFAEVTATFLIEKAAPVNTN